MAVSFAEGAGYVNTAVGALANYANAKTQYRMSEAARKHRETMGNISAALQTNAVTVQQAQTRDAGMRTARDLQLASMRDTGVAEVSAAAAGVRGGSVQSTLRGLERSALKAYGANTFNVASNMRSLQTQKRNIAMQNILARDISTTVPPNPTLAALGLGVRLLQQYDGNQPKGQQSTDILARFKWRKSNG